MSDQAVNISIPQDLPFSSLRLSRDEKGNTRFDWEPLERICAESGLDISLLRDQPEDNVAGIIETWYHHARADGQPADPVMEQLIAEARVEQAIDDASKRRGWRP